jgi:hypothetical protein
MRSRRPTSRGALSLLAAALLAIAIVVPSASAAKQGGKSKGNSTKVNVTKSVNLPIPDRAPGAGGVLGTLRTTIHVGKRVKGLRIRDVNATVTTAGLDADSAEDVFLVLIAPNGATSQLRFNGLAGQSIGPVTFDDESRFFPGFPPCVPGFELCPPYIGNVQPDSPLFVMDGARAKGTWTLIAGDTTNGSTSNLISWRLHLTAGKPFQTK